VDYTLISGAKGIILSLCLLFALFLYVNVSIAQVIEFQIESTDLQVYRDGLVHITQILTVNETLPVLTLTLFGSSVDNFIVLDENQTILDYELEGTNLNVFSLGATIVQVEYDTHSLTMKQAEEWTFLVDTQYNLTVRLPKDSTIVDLNQIPASIDINGNTITLSLFPGYWEIVYVFSLTPPAEFQISNLEVNPNDVEIGEEVTVSVDVVNIGGQTGSSTISFIVNQTTADTRTVTLEKEESTTVEFKISKQTQGTYIVEVAGEVSQFTVGYESSNGGSSNPFPFEYLVAAVAIILLIVIILYFLFRRKANVEKIFKMHPQLNSEERNVIFFLAENKGQAFESQIREQFPDIPRTSLWRLVKRLEKLEIIKVKKIGLENQVELRK
jgi:uncharacterized membrane protein